MAGRNLMKRKAVWGRRLGVLALALFAGPSCGDLTKSGQSAAYMMIDDLAGTSGATGDTSNTLQSDVVTIVDGAATVFEDGGAVVIRLGLKDPGSASAPNTPTFNNYITVTRFRVVFTRADGRNTPGVDVPYPFEGGASFTAVGGTTSATFILVRAQAKLEAPLLALRGLGGAGLISTIAEVTFYGHDQTGIPVSVTGAISVNFADWGDPES
jgi:hypothetical protein